ncbi:MAG TPA: hypothetical protein VG895_00270 [Patescibacteria group bacterium]|nr:hypothetical protein [Gammaproteobacteria bacterium]HWA51476.1 hypothetical protein [Patescibacteria group bacterium]
MPIMLVVMLSSVHSYFVVKLEQPEHVFVPHAAMLTLAAKCRNIEEQFPMQSNIDYQFSNNDPEDKFKNLANFYSVTGGNPLLTGKVLYYEYAKNPTNIGGIFTASSNNEIIGALGTIGFFFIKNNVIIKAALLERLLVNFRFWGKEIFPTLESLVFEKMTVNNEVKFICGLTPKTNPFTIIGYERYDALSTLVLDDIDKFIFKPSGEINIEFGYSDNIQKLICKISQENPTDYFIFYNQEIANWIADDNPFIFRKFISFYKADIFVGYAIIRKNKLGDINIDDIMLSDPTDMNIILPTLISFVKKMEAKKIKLFCFNSDNMYLKNLTTYFLESGFQQESFLSPIVTKTVPNFVLNQRDMVITGSLSPPYWAS